MFSRYQRMAGNKVLMVSGTDEHGTPVLLRDVGQVALGPELGDFADTAAAVGAARVRVLVPEMLNVPGMLAVPPM